MPQVEVKQTAPNKWELAIALSSGNWVRGELEIRGNRANFSCGAGVPPSPLDENEIGQVVGALTGGYIKGKCDDKNPEVRKAFRECHLAGVTSC